MAAIEVHIEGDVLAYSSAADIKAYLGNADKAVELVKEARAEEAREAANATWPRGANDRDNRIAALAQAKCAKAGLYSDDHNHGFSQISIAGNAHSTDDSIPNIYEGSANLG